LPVVLVTGAAGFIGSHLCERLLDAGHRVVGLDNFDCFYPREVKTRNLERASGDTCFALVEGDIRDESTVERVLQRFKPDTIVHLAAKAGVRPSIDEPGAYLSVNVGGTLNLLTACARYPVQQFVLASSSSVYGEAAKVPFAETDATDRPASPYAATKKACEELCFTYHRLLGMQTTCLRLFTVYGPRQRPDLAIHKFARLIEQGSEIPVYGNGSTARDYTYVDDVVDGVMAAISRPKPYAVFNLGRGDPIPLLGMVRALEKALGKEARIDWRPEQPGDVTMTYADIRKASSDLGYAPKVPFEEGIRRFMAWRRQMAPAEVGA
jgi:UDP-glucuronate 4-epimerase